MPLLLFNFQIRKSRKKELEEYSDPSNSQSLKEPEQAGRGGSCEKVGAWQLLGPRPGSGRLVSHLPSLAVSLHMAVPPAPSPRDPGPQALAWEEVEEDGRLRFGSRLVSPPASHIQTHHGQMNCPIGHWSLHPQRAEENGKALYVRQLQHHPKSTCSALFGVTWGACLWGHAWVIWWAGYSYSSVPGGVTWAQHVPSRGPWGVVVLTSGVRGCPACVWQWF